MSLPITCHGLRALDDRNKVLLAHKQLTFEASADFLRAQNSFLVR